MMMFKYIKLSLIFILGFVGIKMILHHHLEIPHAISLGVIVGFLAIGIAASMWSTRREQRTQQ
jgi:tellurite resistance protein TerC